MNIVSIPFLILQTGPAAEPVTLMEAKQFVRIDHNDEDNLLTRLITSARIQVESFISRSLITQTWLLAFDNQAPSEIVLPKGPVQSIASIKTITREGVEVTINSNQYYLNAGKEKLMLTSPLISHMTEIRYVAGYGDAEDVPAPIRQAILNQVAFLYDNRSEISELQHASLSLLSPYRVIRL